MSSKKNDKTSIKLNSILRADSFSSYEQMFDEKTENIINNNNLTNVPEPMISNGTKSLYKSSWLVYVAALCAHMASIVLGSAYGWTAPAMEEMSNDDSRKWQPSMIPSEQEKRLIASSLTIGALFGGLSCGFFLDYLGRRKTLIGLVIPFGIGWFLIGIAKSAILVIIGRIITGLGIGVAIASVPTYLTEISTPKIRGHIGMTFNFFVVFGFVYMDIIFICNYHWNHLALWALLPTFILMFSMFFMPESPTWCINHINDPDKALKEAERNLKRLRSKESDIKNELRDLVEHKRQIENSRKSKIAWSFVSLKRPDIYKPLLIGMALLFFQQFCGINAIQFYMNDIFKTSGSKLTPKQSTLIANGFMLLATIVGGAIIDHLGRRILLISSSFCMMISIGILGIYYKKYPELENRNQLLNNSLPIINATTTEHTSNIPLICLSIFTSSFSLGIGPIAWIIITEITPPQSVGVITSTSSLLAWIFTFIIVNETKVFFELLHPYGTYWLFSGISFICIIFAYFLPETKGKTIEEIGKIFNY